MRAAKSKNRQNSKGSRADFKTQAEINRPSIFGDGFVNRSMQRGSARCCIILQPDFLSLQDRLAERDHSSTGIGVNARFVAVLEATSATNSAPTSP
jgi:hypothetical protein